MCRHTLTHRQELYNIKKNQSNLKGKPCYVHHCESKIYTFLNNQGAVQTRVCCSEKVQSDLSERPQPTDSAAGIQAVSVMSSGLSFSSFFSLLET